MKNLFPRIGLATLCGWFGITRQAYYQHSWRSMDIGIEESIVLKRVIKIRSNHPRIGTRKLYEMIKPMMLEHQIKMGRDGLFDLLSCNNLLIRRRKRRISTTNSSHWLRKYPNLIRELTPAAPNQLWVSDITYWKINGKHVYISFITDVYSHKIVGYQLAETLEAIESVKALKMALKTVQKADIKGLIHHSDRGVQYCSSPYVKLLQDYQIGISMTENGDPLENAVAERINGIIKDEYLENYEISSIKAAKQLLKAVIKLYNQERPHMSISYETPERIHQRENKMKIERKWKNYYTKKTNFVNPEQDEHKPVNLEQD